jgi:hypothetical protein
MRMTRFLVGYFAVTFFLTATVWATTGHAEPFLGALAAAAVMLPLSWWGEQ